MQVEPSVERVAELAARLKREPAKALVDFVDLRAVALPVLRDRVLVNFQPEADGIEPDEIVRRLLDR